MPFYIGRRVSQGFEKVRTVRDAHSKQKYFYHVDKLISAFIRSHTTKGRVNEILSGEEVNVYLI